MRKAVKNKVSIKVPVRADFAGGFSDQSYYLEKYRIQEGKVTNIALPVYIYVEAKINKNDKEIKINMPDLKQKIEGDFSALERQEHDNISQITRHFIKLFDLNHEGININISSKGKIPPASGLGTSSAAGVAVIMALSELFGLYGVNPCELNYLVELSMGVMGGKQDYYSAWLGGINHLSFSGPGKSLVTVENNLTEESKQYKWLLKKIFVYYSGQSRSSGIANAEPEIKVRKDPKILERIAEVADTGWEAINNMDEKNLKIAISKDRKNRQELSENYYTEMITEMTKIGEELGYEHRVCGAGSGGCILFFGDEKNHQNLEKKLSKLGGYRVC